MKRNTFLAKTTNPNMTAGRFRTACAARLLPLLLLLLPTAVQAQFTYTTNNGTITITKYTGSGGAVTIPDTINGLPVTSIGDGAFYDCTKLTSVTIPTNVTSIGGSAFAYCYSLTSVTIPNSVTSIGGSAFISCALTNVTISNSVTNIGDDAFIYCTSLMAITVDALNSDYSSVEGVLFNKSQTTLIQCPGGKAGQCTVPSSVTSIGEGAFVLCSKLTAITVDALNSDYSSVEGVLFNKSQTTLIQCPEGRAGQYTVPSSVTSIGHGAFAFCALTSVTIPNSVTSFGECAFCYCDSLTNAAIGDSVTSIEKNTFYHCTSLTSVTIPDSVTSIGNSAFYECHNLANVTIGNSVTSIGMLAFFGCYGLTNVMIGKSVTSIGGCAFDWCLRLTTVYFQGNAPSIDWDIFMNGPNVIVYYLPGTTGWDAFFAKTWNPTVPWYLPNPTILNFEPNFGVQTNGFGFTISWATNISVVVEVCTNFANPMWQPVQTNTLTGGSCYFSDPDWTNYSSRFYRLRSP